jgi:hypothetical protein
MVRGSPEQKKLHDAVYKEIYTAAERARMKKLPLGWLPNAINQRVHIKSMRNDGHESIVLYLSEPKLFIHAHHYETRNPKLDGPKSHVLAEDEFISEQWRSKRNELQRKVDGFLSQCRTCDQLIERWPEVLALMPEGFFKPEPIGTALVIQSSELNAILGLQ